MASSLKGLDAVCKQVIIDFVQEASKKTPNDGIFGTTTGQDATVEVEQEKNGTSKKRLPLGLTCYFKLLREE